MSNSISQKLETKDRREVDRWSDVVRGARLTKPKIHSILHPEIVAHTIRDPKAWYLQREGSQSLEVHAQIHCFRVNTTGVDIHACHYTPFALLSKANSHSICTGIEEEFICTITLDGQCCHRIPEFISNIFIRDPSCALTRDGVSVSSLQLVQGASTCTYGCTVRSFVAHATWESRASPAIEHSTSKTRFVRLHDTVHTLGKKKIPLYSLHKQWDTR